MYSGKWKQKIMKPDVSGKEPRQYPKSKHVMA